MPGNNIDNGDPICSPDSRMIAFTSVNHYYYTNFSDIQIILANGTPRSQLTHKGIASNPAWRP
ncbi:MAG: PD40 domain-containing protein [Anaerolineae bacterium]|nr:PD40 domain-containing protein [Gemmatimonadaceae bacterium]